MASLALGAIGAGVGSMFGFASIGWSIGSFIGGQLFGPEGQDIEGPRLNNKQVTSSAYGNMRPLIYGSYRVAGDIIWSTDLVEHAHKEEAGKGGGGGSYTTYTYTMSFALALCAGPISGVRKIWFNSELVYSVADDASVAEIKASNEKSKGFRVYKGTTTQTADPTYQASVGAANAPAYRGTAYIVWKDLDVTKYGGIPNIQVEVVQNGTDSIVSKDTLPGSLQQSQRMSVHFGDGVAYVFIADGATPDSFDIKTYSLASNALLNTDYYYYDALGSEDSGIFRFLYTESVSPSGKIGIIQAGDLGTGNNSRFWVVSLGFPVLFQTYRLLIDNDLDNYTNGSDVSYQLKWQQVDGIDAYLWFYKSNSGQMYRYALPLPVGVTLSLEQDEVFQVDSSRLGLDPVAARFAWSLDAVSDEFYVKVEDYNTSATSIKRYDFDGNFIESKFSGTDSGIPFAVSNGRLWVASGSNLQIYDWASESLLFSQNIPNLSNIASSSTRSLFELSGNVLVILSNGIIYRFILSLSNDGYSLDQVVTDICDRVGIDSSDIDVTDLDDTVRGFMVSRQNTARASLEQLSAAFFFDGRESDGVIEFIKRGGTSIATLSDDDVGCYEVEVVELFDVTRTQEEELPRSITLNYANIDADYQTGAQNATRQAILNGTETTVEIALVLNDDEAKTIVDTMMYSLWENRNKYKLNTWLKYVKIDPSDIITADGKTLRVTARNEGVNGLIEIEAVKELPAIYTGQVGTGVDSGHVNQAINIPGPTLFHLLDIPPLRDNDYDEYGIYFAADGYFDSWSGAAALRSPDGTTYETRGTTDSGAPIGQAITVLGDFTGGNIFDETNIVRVQVSSVLESKTESEVLNGANIALIGDELVQFKNADLVSTGVYDLSGLLRGRIGTTWSMASHVINERFVLLDSDSTRFLAIPTNDLNTSRIWAALTLGKTIENAQRTSLTYSANNIKPITPVHIGGGTAGFNTAWTIQWIRSTRWKWQWKDLITGGQDESSYDFEVRIYDDPDTPTTVIRTITVTNATASGGFFSTTYSNTDQVTDFNSHQVRLAISIRQVGATRNSEWSDIQVVDSGLTDTSTVLMHMNGTNGSTTFIDEYFYTVTAFNGAQISTAQSELGGASGLFDGVDDRVEITSSTDLNLGSSDFTLEVFARWTTLPTSGNVQTIASRWSSATTRHFSAWLWNDAGTNKIQFAISTTGSNVVNKFFNWTPSTATWYHIAFVRYENVLTCYIDGVSIGTQAMTETVFAVSNPLLLGATFNGGASYIYFTNGHLDEFRLTVGKARYLANFTPPSSEFTY